MRINQLPGATDTAASFQFEGEGHTLGNALRFAIMKKYVPARTAPVLLSTLIFIKELLRMLESSQNGKALC